jgi:aerobic carbon-monoxide dehydrogenase large subunit
MYGGSAQGLGQALTAGLVYSPEGRLRTGSLLDYPVPTAAEMASLLLEIGETPSTNPLGVKGIGELPPTVTAPVAIQRR